MRGAPGWRRPLAQAAAEAERVEPFPAGRYHCFCFRCLTHFRADDLIILDVTLCVFRFGAVGRANERQLFPRQPC